MHDTFVYDIILCIMGIFIFLHLAFLWLFLRAMSNMTDGFNQVIRGLEAITEELVGLRQDRR